MAHNMIPFKFRERELLFIYGPCGTFSDFMLYSMWFKSLYHYNLLQLVQIKCIKKYYVIKMKNRIILVPKASRDQIKMGLRALGQMKPLAWLKSISTEFIDLAPFERVIRANRSETLKGLDLG